MSCRSSNVWVEKIVCDGKLIRMKIDTGAQVNLLSVGDALYLGKLGMSPTYTYTVIEAFGGTKYISKGRVNVSPKLKISVIKLTFSVIDGWDQPILGLRDAIALEICNLVSNLYRTT